MNKSNLWQELQQDPNSAVMPYTCSNTMHTHVSFECLTMKEIWLLTIRALMAADQVAFQRITGESVSKKKMLS